MANHSLSYYLLIFAVITILVIVGLLAFSSGKKSTTSIVPAIVLDEFTQTRVNSNETYVKVGTSGSNVVSSTTTVTHRTSKPKE